MSKQLIALLNKKLAEIALDGRLDTETCRNALKEELQYYVLNFIYHHPEYSRFIMYGGSSLRIIHGLNRMSVDLDFECAHPITNQFLEKLKKEIADHFTSRYGAEADFLTVKVTNSRGLKLKFNVGEAVRFGHPSKQVDVKIDLNHFVIVKPVTERRPINQDQLSFVIITYNMGTLMASKIAAIFLRGARGVGKEVYEEKGRDIYDLLWYMGKKIVPDFDYLIAKGIDLKSPRALFDQLTIQMNKVNDRNLKQDLEPLFVNKTFIENWLENWRESYIQLLKQYKIRTLKEIERVRVHHHFDHIVRDVFSFTYIYKTEDGESFRIRYLISADFIDSQSGGLPTEVSQAMGDGIQFTSDGASSIGMPEERLKQYATLFNQKTEQYFEKTNGVALGDEIITKVIRMTAVQLNQKEEIALNKSALLSCTLDDLLK